VNDTVVIYDRVREALRKYPRMPFRDLINLALN
jgi:preprotein translocase subunit SecF